MAFSLKLLFFALHLPFGTELKLQYNYVNDDIAD